MQQLKAMFKSVPAKAGLAAGAMIVAGQAFAEATPIDVSDVIATLAAAVITVTAVCTAALTVVVVIKVFKYVRAAF